MPGGNAPFRRVGGFVRGSAGGISTRSAFSGAIPHSERRRANRCNEDQDDDRTQRGGERFFCTDKSREVYDSRESGGCQADFGGDGRGRRKSFIHSGITTVCFLPVRFEDSSS